MRKNSIGRFFIHRLATDTALHKNSASYLCASASPRREKSRTFPHTPTAQPTRSARQLQSPLHRGVGQTASLVRSACLLHANHLEAHGRANGRARKAARSAARRGRAEARDAWDSAAESRRSPRRGGGTDFENINTLGFPNRRLVQSLALHHRFGRSVSGAGLYSNRRSNRLYENPAVPPTSAVKSGELSDPGATRPGAFMPQLCFANTCFVSKTDLGRAFVCNAAGGEFWRRL